MNNPNYGKTIHITAEILEVKEPEKTYTLNEIKEAFELFLRKVENE